MKKVITYGTFDLFHMGHLEILRRAKSLGQHLTVAISTDRFNTEDKGKFCIVPFEERVAIVKAIKFVDEVIAEDGWNQKATDIKANSIDVFVMGDDWEGKFDELEKLCEVVYLPRTKGISTTDLKARVFERQKQING